MEKQSYITTRQLIVLLIMTRLPFSTSYYVSLGAGRSIQDILFAVPVNFVLNFIVAVPILVLLKRHPGKDLVELAQNIMGRAAGVVIAIFYMLCFIGVSVYILSISVDYFVNSVIPESTYYAIAIPLLIVAFYGAVKGIETIARFGTVVIAVYLAILVVIVLSLFQNINLGYLMPVFYSGPQYFLKAVVDGINSNIQIIMVAFCAPFIKTGIKLGKTYAEWNSYASLLFLALEFLSVIVLGPFAAKQNFPLSAMAMQSKIGVFERIDEVDMMSWIINAVFIVTFEIYLASVCLLKIGLNKHRKKVVFLITVVVYTLGYLVIGHFNGLHAITLSPLVTVVTLIAIIAIPFVILLADMLKGRVAGNEKAT